MNEQEIILKDLNEYMKERGIELDLLPSFLIFNGFSYYFTEGRINALSGGFYIFLADPKYREKFLEHLRSRKDIK